MYNGLCRYLTTEKLLYLKQLGLSTGLSTEHAIVKLVDQIFKSFEKYHYTVGDFVDFLKAFDLVEYTIVYKNLKCVVSRSLLLLDFLVK